MTPPPDVAPAFRPAAPFGADLRSLALLRVGLAGALLGDLLFYRLPAWERHHTDLGWLSRADLLAGYASPYDVSLYFLAGSTGGTLLLAGATVVAALALLLGWHTRLAALATWALVHSLHVRTPILTVGGDQWLRLLLFWGMFLPWGRVWSLDARRAAAPPPPPPGAREGVSLATVALVVQVLLLYLVGVVHKSGAAWWNGTAVFDALAMDSERRWAGDWLLARPALCTVLTWATLAVEVGAGIALMLPWRRGPVRTAAVGALLLLHVGLWSSLTLGIFPFVNVASVLALLPAWFWEAGPGRRAAAWLDARDAAARARAAARPAPAPAAAEDAPSPAGAAPADTASCSLPAGRAAAADPFRLRPAAIAFVGACLAYVLYYTAAGLTHPPALPLRAVYPFGKALGLNQRFVMYSPEPSREDGWLVARALLADGREVDLLAPDAARTLSWTLGAPIRARYGGRFAGFRDQTFLRGVWYDRRPYARLAAPFARALAREWEREGGAPVVEVALVWMRLLRESGPPRVDWRGPWPSVLARVARRADGGWETLAADAPFPELRAARRGYRATTAFAPPAAR